MNKREEIMEFIEGLFDVNNPEISFFLPPEYDDAIIGYIERFTDKGILTKTLYNGVMVPLDVYKYLGLFNSVVLDPTQKYPDKFDSHEEYMRMDDYDDAIIGILHDVDHKSCFVYDEAIVLNMLYRSGMEESEAIEFMNYNQKGAYVGERTPAFATILFPIETKEQIIANIIRNDPIIV